MSITQIPDSLEPALRKLLTQQVAIQPFTGSDQYGQPTYGPSQNWPAQVFGLPDRQITKNGIIVIEWCMVILPVEAPVTASTLITLPDGSVVPVLGVETLFDERGPHHLEVYAGHQPTVFGLFS